MDQKKIFSLMKKSESYPHATNKIKNIQTHISSVFLTGEFVYKIKKSVNFDFLDFSTLEKRKFFCEEEIRLNKRLSPDIYLDVVPIIKKDMDSIIVDGQGSIVEYAVKMKQFPQEYIMSNQLNKDNVGRHHIDRIIDSLVLFYQNQKSTKEILSYGKREAVEKNISENFQQTQSFIGKTIDKEQYESIKQMNSDFLSSADSLFQKRMDDGFIKPCHGDLHSGNIVLWNDEISIFDCIEFNKRFQYIDVASDVGFLAMDLDYQNRPFLSSYLVEEYMKENDDESLLDMLNFYKSYRAYVRGKVTGFQLSDPHIPDEKKTHVMQITDRYFRLSEYYMKLCYLLNHLDGPLVFLVCGLTGTGKSTLSSKLAVDYDAMVINTDVVRKKMAGIDTFARRLHKPDTGLYAKEKRDETYHQVFSFASQRLKDKRNVILDATFQYRKHRSAVEDLVDRYDGVLVRIKCSSPDEVVRQWLEQRMKSKSASDGRWEIYKVQKDSSEKMSKDEPFIAVDLSMDDFEERMTVFQNIQDVIVAKM